MNRLILPLLVSISVCITSCSKQSGNTSGECDTTYTVQYSDSPEFKRILKETMFYINCRDHYSLKPETIDIAYWTCQNNSMERPLRRDYYAKVIGKCNDRTFYMSTVRYWKKFGYGLWMDITDNDSTGFYILFDSEGHTTIRR